MVLRVSAIMLLLALLIAASQMCVAPRAAAQAGGASVPEVVEAIGRARVASIP